MLIRLPRPKSMITWRFYFWYFRDRYCSLYSPQLCWGLNGRSVMEMIAKIRERKGRLDLPIVSGKHLRRISDRTALQSADNVEKFITTRKIDSFESLAKFTADREQKYQQLETVHLSKGQKLSRLKELSKLYALFAPIQATYKESQSLKGLAKMKYDREHK